MKCARSKSMSVITERGDPSWRPPHFPPACEACNGFAYVRLGERDALTKCRACGGSGNAVSLTEWLRRHHA